MNPRWPPTCSWRESRSKTRFRALVYWHPGNFTRATGLRGNRSRLPCWGAPLIELDSADLRDTRQREKKGTSSGANQCAACYAKLRLRRALS